MPSWSPCHSPRTRTPGSRKAQEYKHLVYSPAIPFLKAFLMANEDVQQEDYQAHLGICQAIKLVRLQNDATFALREGLASGI
jgi:hypothetical protein